MTKSDDEIRRKVEQALADRLRNVRGGRNIAPQNERYIPRYDENFPGRNSKINEGVDGDPDDEDFSKETSRLRNRDGD